MSQTSLGRHLGGIAAAVLAGALLTVAPLGAQAGALDGKGQGEPAPAAGARTRRRWPARRPWR